MERAYIVFSGRVQGVGFRWFATQTATRLGVTGWVRNLDNGDVDCEVQGTEAQIDRFIHDMCHANRWISVSTYKKTMIPAVTNEKKFIMRN